MPSLEQLTHAIKQAFEQQSYADALRALPQIQVLLLENSLLIPDLTKISSVHYVNDLSLSRGVLEIGALSAINCHELDKFEKLVLQLKSFYFNAANNATLAKSSKKNKILSLYLLQLLSKGDVVHFHSELEFLNQHLKSMDTDLYLNYPVKIENWVLEGYYDKAVSLIKNTESEEKLKLKEFNIFDRTLLQAIRLEISRSMEKSYQSLPLSNARYLLFLNSEKEVEQWAVQQGWPVVKNEIVFKEQEVVGDDEEAYNSSQRLVKNTLNYAREIDSII